MVVVLAGGPQTLEPDSEPLERVVTSLQERGSHVITVGVGDQVDRLELRLTVERDEDLFLADNFKDLLFKVDNIVDRMCHYATEAVQLQGELQSKSTISKHCMAEGWTSYC